MRYRAVAILALGAALLHCGDAGESPLAPPRPPGPPAAKLIPSDSTLVNTASADTVHFDVHYDEWDRSDIEDCRRAGGRWLNFGGAKARCSEVRGYRPAWPDRDCGAAYDYGGPVPAWVSDFYARHGVCPAPGRPSPTPQMAPGATADDALDCPEVEVQDPPPRDPDPERPPKPLGSPPEDPPPEEEVEVQDPPPRDPDPERPPPPEPPPPTMNATAHLHTSIGSLRVTLTRPPGAAGNAWEIETQEGTGSAS